MSTIETRRDQMFPKLRPEEVDRLRRFGEVRRYAPGDLLFVTGERSPGMFVLIAGTVAVSSAPASRPLRLVNTPPCYFGPLVVQYPKSMRERLMHSLENSIGEKRLCVRHHVRKIGQVGPHPIQDFGRGSLANYPNKFDLKHGRLLFASG
jgi:hypothetical protein